MIICPIFFFSSNVVSVDKDVRGHSHMHHHPSIVPSYQNRRAVVIAHVLEFGIVVHSVIIGIDLGITTDLDELRPLLIGLCFHQLFEGIGLGSAIAVARVSRLRAIIFAVIFVLTAPVGVGIGIGIVSSYDPESNTAAWVAGMLNAMAAGILIYAGLVDMIVEDFQRCEDASPTKKIMMALFVLFGYGAMTLLANWA
jgi:zinc transporter 1/2/3